MRFHHKRYEMEKETLANQDHRNQLRPKINKKKFESTSGREFLYMLYEPLNQAGFESEVVPRLSAGQKALYYWFNLDLRVCGEGFQGFFYSDINNSFRTSVLAGLKLIGDDQLSRLVEKAHSLFKDNANLDETTPEDFLESPEYKNHPIGACDKDYISVRRESIKLLEKYIRRYPSEFCVFEIGIPVKRRKKEVSKASSTSTINSSQTISSKKENKNPVEVKPKLTKNETFYKNGKLKQVEFKNLQGKRIGSYLHYWNNGQKRLEAEDASGKTLLHNFWDKNGNQLLKNGTGVYFTEKLVKSDNVIRKRFEYQYENYVLSGVTKEFHNRVLIRTIEYHNGKRHGITRLYNKQGELIEERIYKNNNHVATSRV